MFELQEQSPLSYFKQISPTHRYGKVAESTIDRLFEAQKIKRFLLSPPLDYIFYRGFKQNTASAMVIDTLSSSDHNPLLVELCT